MSIYMYVCIFMSISFYACRCTHTDTYQYNMHASVRVSLNKSWPCPNCGAAAPNFHIAKGPCSLGSSQASTPWTWLRACRGGGGVAGNNAYNVNRLLFQHLPLDLREKRDSSVADLHGQVNPETNSNSTFFIIYFSVSHI